MLNDCILASCDHGEQKAHYYEMLPGLMDIQGKKAIVGLGEDVESYWVLRKTKFSRSENELELIMHNRIVIYRGI